MLIDDGAIETREYLKADNWKTVMSIKSSAGNLFLDVRKWSKFHNQDEYYPRKAGIMLSLEDWVNIRKDIDELIANHYHKDKSSTVE